MKKILISSLLISVLSGSLQAAEAGAARESGEVEESGEHAEAAKAATPQKRPRCKSYTIKKGSILWYLDNPKRDTQGKRINPFPLRTETVDGEDHVILRLENITSLKGILSVLGIQTVTDIEIPESAFPEGNIPKARDFVEVKNLKSLILGYCPNLKALPLGSFAGFDFLTSLEISECERLINIIPDAFAGLVNLRSLNLSNCLNLNVIPGIFGGLINLTSLNLMAACIDLETLEPEILAGLVNLTSLNLSWNDNLKTIKAGAFAGPRNLRSLNLNDCEKLRTIESGALTVLRNLESLDLSKNNVDNDDEIFIQRTEELEDDLAILRQNGCHILQ